MLKVSLVFSLRTDYTKIYKSPSPSPTNPSFVSPFSFLLHLFLFQDPYYNNKKPNSTSIFSRHYQKQDRLLRGLLLLLVFNVLNNKSLVRHKTASLFKGQGMWEKAKKKKIKREAMMGIKAESGACSNKKGNKRNRTKTMLRVT